MCSGVVPRRRCRCGSRQWGRQNAHHGLPRTSWHSRNRYMCTRHTTCMTPSSFYLNNFLYTHTCTRRSGYELRSELVEESRHAATEAGVADRIEFVEGDIFAVNVLHLTTTTCAGFGMAGASATVALLYLLPKILRKLKPTLEPVAFIAHLTHQFSNQMHDVFLIGADACHSCCALGDGLSRSSTPFRGGHLCKLTLHIACICTRRNH